MDDEHYRDGGPNWTPLIIAFILSICAILALGGAMASSGGQW